MATTPAPADPPAAPAALPDPAEWRRLSPLLDELLDLPTAERSARLAALASEVPSLADALRGLLAEDDAARAGRFLAGQAAAPEGGHGLVGLTIGAYALEAPLGHGGSGSVWRARRNDGRHDGLAAVKLLHLSLLGNSAAARFRREGQILARLAHPHIARLLDTGITPGGQPFLVLELVEGRPIDEQCDALGLDVDARIRLFIDVLAAVGHAHRHLVVHRDIKPANVLMTAEGQVKLLDFGIAKLVNDDELPSEATALTREAGRVLTPAYAAPEQFSGAPISTATDIYALGVLLYRLLVGQHPTSPDGASGSALIHASIHTEAWRASRAALRPRETQSLPADLERIARQRASTPDRLARRLRGDLDNILDRMLRKRPSERYRSVDAVASDLRKHLAHLPVSARPDTWPYRVSKFVRRHRVLAGASAVLVLSVAAGIAGTLSQAERAQRLGELAQQQRDLAWRELALAEATNEFIGNVLTEGSRRPQSSAALLDQAGQLLEAQFAGVPAMKARTQLMLGTMYSELLQTSKALAMLDSAADLAARHPDALGPATRGEVDCLRTALRRDLPGLERALAGLPPATLPADASHDAAQTDAAQSRAVCLTRRSVLLRREGQLKAAEADAREALRLLGTPRPGQELAVIHAQRELASAIGNQGANAQAVQAWRELLALLEARGRARSVYAATAYNNLATRLASAGQELAAVEAQQQAVDIWRGLQGEDQLNPQLWANLAVSLDGVGRRDEADAAYRRAIDRLQADTPEDVRGHTVRIGALLACRAGRQSECERLVREAERLQRQDLPPDHIDRAMLLRLQASRDELRGDLPAERNALTEALRIARASPVRTPLQVSTAGRLAEVERLLGQPKAAHQAADEAEAAARALSRGFENSRGVGMALLVRGRLLAAEGHLDKARATLQEALVHLVATSGSSSPTAVQVVRTLTELDAAKAVAGPASAPALAQNLLTSPSRE